MTKILARLFVLFAILAFSANASQNSVVLPTVSPYPGLTMLGNINSAFNTFQTNFSGSSAPGTPATYQFWADTTTSTLKIYDGAAWQPIGSFSSGWVPMSYGFKQLAIVSTGSANAYVVTYSPAATAYKLGQKYSFITNFANTAASTVNVNSIGAIALKKQGGVALASGDLGSGLAVDCVYDGTNCQITSAISSAATGTVTNVTAGTGLAGGSITTSGTISLGTSAANTILANNTGSSAVPIGTSLTALMDANLGSTQGQMAYRNATVWTVLPPGTNGQVLTTGGTAANLSWATNTSPTKAWVNFNGSSSTVNKSLNVSGISRFATASYTVTFASSMADANYGVVVSYGGVPSVNGNSAIGGVCSASLGGTASNKTVSAVNVCINTNGGAIDYGDITVEILD